MRILHVLSSRPDACLTEIAKDAALSEATVLRYLGSLATFAFVERTPDNRYRLGWELFRLGQQVVSDQIPGPQARPIMDLLHEQFNETVNLAYRRGDEVVIVDVLHGGRAIKKLNEVGQRDPWHASALGKAILSTMPPEERRTLIRRKGLQRFTPNTIVDADALEADLERVRIRGYSIDKEEAEEDLTCVGAAVPTASGISQLALSVSFLTHRLKPSDIPTAGNAIHDAANRLSKLILSG